MHKIILKNNQEAVIDTWSFYKLEDYVSQDLPVSKTLSRGRVVFQGFTFLRPNLAWEVRRYDQEHDYSKEKQLSPLENHLDINKPREDYHKAIIAKQDESLIGILLCQWVKSPGGFWRYHIRLLDVHEDHKNQGVASNLVRELNQADFIKGKILQRGESTIEGQMHLTKLMKHELKAQDYAVIPPDYCSIEPPITFGMHRRPPRNQVFGFP